MYHLWPNATHTVLEKYKDDPALLDLLKTTEANDLLLEIDEQSGIATCLCCFTTFQTRGLITQPFRQHAAYESHINNLYVRTQAFHGVRYCCSYVVMALRCVHDDNDDNVALAQVSVIN